MKHLDVVNGYTGPPNGLYVAVVPTRESLNALFHNFLSGLAYNPSDLHVTLVFSKPVDVQKVNGTVNPDLVFQSVVSDIDILGKCLVVKLTSNDLVNRHRVWRAIGATHEFPEFIPHISLALNEGPSALVDQYIRKCRRQLATGPGVSLSFDREFSDNLR